MSLVSVRAALVERFVAGSFFSSANIAWESVPFTPPQAAWGRFTFMPDEGRPFTSGPLGLDRYDGMAQISVHTPRQVGDGAGAVIAESIRVYFTAGRVLTYSGQSVRIQSCSRNTGRIDNDFFQIAVSVNWYALITRAAV